MNASTFKFITAVCTCTGRLYSRYYTLPVYTCILETNQLRQKFTLIPDMPRPVKKPLRMLSRIQLSRATTFSPVTRSLKHMLPFPREWLKRTSPLDPHIKGVPSKQRIRWWNIVPGDSVRVRNQKKKYDVVAINKISNRVFLADPDAGVCLFSCFC